MASLKIKKKYKKSRSCLSLLPLKKFRSYRGDKKKYDGFYKKKNFEKKTNEREKRKKKK